MHCVQALCDNGQILTAAKLGNMWVMPKDMPKSTNNRTKATKEALKDND